MRLYSKRFSVKDKINLQLYDVLNNVPRIIVQNKKGFSPHEGNLIKKNRKKPQHFPVSSEV